MLAFLTRRQFAFALLLGISLVLPISYFTLARNKSRNDRKLERAEQLGSKDSLNPTNKNYSLSLDADNDGIPNEAELESYSDRENFRLWFTLVAEGQFYRLSDDWNAGQRDCAGLVRFAWREALRKHDRLWFQKMGPGYKTVAADVARYDLASGPLGEKLFRTNFGAYKDGEIDNGMFSEFADARTLKSFNAKFISRDRHNAQPGDLLFFYQPWVQKFPYHVMLFIGDSKLSGEKSADWVVYHTGASPVDEGAVKKVELSVLDQHPNKRWRPVESNSHFLGFYRLKILD